MIFLTTYREYYGEYASGELELLMEHFYTYESRGGDGEAKAASRCGDKLGRYYCDMDTDKSAADDNYCDVVGNQGLALLLHTDGHPDEGPSYDGLRKFLEVTGVDPAKTTAMYLLVLDEDSGVPDRRDLYRVDRSGVYRYGAEDVDDSLFPQRLRERAADWTNGKLDLKEF